MSEEQSTDRFLECLRLTDILEGNDSNDKEDKGGFTRGGAIQEDCDEYADRKGIPHFSVHDLTPEQRTELFRILYYNEARCDLLPAPLDFVLYQYAVNRYPQAAVKMLQIALGLGVCDGVLSPNGATITKVRGMGARTTCGLLLTEQAHNYERIVMKSNTKVKAWFAAGKKGEDPKDQRSFGPGWLNRCEKVAVMAGVLWTAPSGLREWLDQQHTDYKAGISPA